MCVHEYLKGVSKKYQCFKGGVFRGSFKDVLKDFQTDKCFKEFLKVCYGTFRKFPGSIKELLRFF